MREKMGEGMQTRDIVILILAVLSLAMAMT